VTFYKGYADPRTITPEIVADPGSLTAVVNKYHALTADYVPALVTADGTTCEVHPEANEAWIQLRDACWQAIGVRLRMLSGYRSYERQAKSFADALARKGLLGTLPYNAYQGRSEHQTGLAIDVTDGIATPLTLGFAKTASYAWLKEHAHEYGFILRYMSGKEAVTGYAFEPWHYRFVGIDAAAQCVQNGWCLEEYAGLAK